LYAYHPSTALDVLESRLGEIKASRPVRTWKFTRIKMDDEGPATYRGVAVVLVNRRTFSSAATAAGFAKAIPGCLLVGESTNTGGAFGDIFLYRLPHSRILLALPHNFGFHAGGTPDGERKPDLWLDSEHPVAEVIHWLRAPNDYVNGDSKSP